MMNLNMHIQLLRAFVSLVLLSLLVSLAGHANAVTVSIRVDNDNRDAEELISDGDMYRDSSDLELGFDDFAGGLQIVGMLFRNVDIPQGAQINSAYIEFETDETDSGTTNLLIYAEDEDNAGNIGNNDNNLSDRTPTSATETWSPGAWNTVNQKHQTPDLRLIIQELVDRPGWVANNNMALLVAPGTGCSTIDCRRRAESHDGESANAPLLVIDYTENTLPSVTSVGGACGADNVLIVEFDSAVGAEALDTSLYTLNVGTVTAAVAQSDTVIVLSVTGLVAGTSTTLSIEGVDQAIDYAGLLGRYFDQRSGAGGAKVNYTTGLFSGDEFLRLDSQVNFNWGSGTPTIFPSVSGNNERFSIRWTGSVVPTVTGSYEFRLYSDDGMRLDLDGTQIVDYWTLHGPSYSSISAAQALTSGQAYTVQAEHYEHTGQAVAQIEWRRDGGAWENIPNTNLHTCPTIVPLLSPDIELRMDETVWSGAIDEVQDSTGNGNDGVAAGGATTTAISDGYICRAGEFDGVDDYIEMGAGALDALRGTASLSFWIKTTQTGNNTGWQAPGIAGVEEAGGSDDIFWGWLDASGRIGLSVANDFSTKSTIAINDDVFHHIVLTRDSAAGNYQIYIDGALNNSGSLPGGTIGNVFSSIGRIEDTGGSEEYFQGTLDELKIFSSVISSADVTTLFNETRPCGGTLPFAHYAFEQAAWSGPGVVIEDYTGNGNAGVSVGSSLVAYNADGYVCRGADIPDNGTVAQIDAINTQQDINTALGNEGSIMFWFRSESDWIGSGDRTLIDASTRVFNNANDKYFFVSKRNNGSLRFSLEDSNDGDFTFDSSVQNILAATWTHVAVTWDFPNDVVEIFVDGTSVGSQTFSTNGVLGDLGEIYIGDNSSSYNIAPGASAYGRFDEIRLYTEVLSEAEIGIASAESHPCIASCDLDRFGVTQQARGLACPQTRATVQIEALCADGTVKTDYTGSVDLSSDENSLSLFYLASTGGSEITSYTFDGSESGDRTVYLFHQNENSDVRVTASDTVASISSAASSGTDFRTSGFVASAPANFSCGGSTSVTLTAIGQDVSGGGSCNVLTGFTGSKGLKIWSDINIDIAESPGVKDTSLPRSMTINGSTISENQPAANNTSATFNSGIGSLSIGYLDVGEVLGVNILHDDAPYDGSVAEFSSLQASVSPFIVSPASTAVAATSAAGACAGGTEALLGACSVLGAAGSDFSITAQALCSDVGNSLAPSYRGTVGLSHQLIAPSGGTAGSLSVSQAVFDGTETTPGERVIADQQVSEVGVFTLTTASSSYFGELVPGSVSDNIGRFTPSYFDVVASNGALASACGTFSYIGQPTTYAVGAVPSATITARNASGGVTENYTDTNFLKMTALDVARGFPTADNTTNGADAATLMSVTSLVNSGSLAVSTAGVLDYQFDTADSYIYTKNLNSLVGPFTSSFDITASAIDDSDSVSAALFPTWTPTGVELRYGRWRTENVFGPESDDLLMFGQTEYLDAGGDFVLNAADSCTNITAGISVTDSGGASVSSPYNSITVGDGSSALTFDGPVSGGLASLTFAQPGLAAPGDDHSGSIDFEVDLTTLPWLRFNWDGSVDGSLEDAPVSAATFGQYRGHDRIIYWREIQ